MKLTDADTVARLSGVCRRTVIARAASRGGVVYLGNKAFLKGHDPSVESTPVRGKQLTLQQAATIIGCSRSTILRVLERTGLGVKLGNRRYLPESQLNQVRNSVLAVGVTRIHSDKKAMSERGKRMAQARWS